MLKIEYTSQEERKNIIQNNKDEGLVLIKDVIEGTTEKIMYLIFTTNVTPEPTELELLQQRLELMQNALDDLILGGM